MFMGGENAHWLRTFFANDNSDSYVRLLLQLCKRELVLLEDRVSELKSPGLLNIFPTSYY